MRVARAWVALVIVGVLAAGAAAADPVRFCITADNRDYKGFVSVLDKLKAVSGGPGLFMISAGDFAPARLTRQDINKVFGESFPWYPVVGNHEITTSASIAIMGWATLPEDLAPKDRATDTEKAPPADRAEAKDAAPPANTMEYLRHFFEKHIKDKANPGPEGTRETTYSFDVGDVHLVVLNEYWNGKAEPGSDTRGNGEVVEPLRDWLAADLRATTKPWKIVVGHEPAYPQPDRDWETGRHPADQMTRHSADRDAFWAVLERYGAAAYICGHTHRYSRYQPEGSKVWQIDAAQARGNKDWKYDAFLIVTANAKHLKFEVYRNLLAQGQFTLTDTLTLSSGGSRPAAVLGEAQRPPTRR